MVTYTNVTQVPVITSVAVLPGLSFTLCCKTERLCCGHTTAAYLVNTMPLWLIQTGSIINRAVAEILPLYSDACCRIISLLRISGFYEAFNLCQPSYLSIGPGKGISALPLSAKKSPKESNHPGLDGTSAYEKCAENKNGGYIFNKQNTCQLFIFHDLLEIFMGWIDTVFGSFADDSGCIYL